jgi:hypothetical protein
MNGTVGCESKIPVESALILRSLKTYTYSRRPIAAAMACILLIHTARASPLLGLPDFENGRYLTHSQGTSS